ncbi:phage late control D family protein [Geodermatophilus sp. SYSU D00742]
MSTQAIYADQDFYVPAFELRLRGASAPRDVIRDVTQVSFKDSLIDVDSFDVTINNWDADSRAFKYSDDYLFDPGTQVELWMGYHDSSLQLMITGEVVELRPSFPASGQPTLTIHGMNLLHRLRKEQRSRSYVDKTDTEIATLIAADLGVTLAPASADVRMREPRNAYLVQDNAYDIVFLLDRARRIGYELRVDEIGTDGTVQSRRLVFAPSTTVARPTYELRYGQSLIEFQPNLSTANQVGSVVVRGWDAANKKSFEHTATLDDLKTRGLGPQGRNATLYRSFQDRKEVIATAVVGSKAEAEQLALETLQLIAKGLVTGSGSVVGLPDLRAGSVVMISGIGTRFDGRYFVTETTHTIGDGGYTTQFGFRREEIKGGS